jgi:ElaB/YqjD/DUF883 family membrane-anchored ribosome-binding protein
MNQNITPQQPPNPEGGAATELRQDAQQLGSTAANRLHSEVDARKGAAVSQAQSVSSAITQTAEGLGEDSPEWLKSALRQGAQQIQRFADTIEQRDSRQMMSEAQNFARNNPGTFLAACAAVGFAAARVLKAGAEQQRTGQLNQSPSFGGNAPSGQGQAFQGQSQPSRAVEPAYGSSAGGGYGAGVNAPGGFV